MNGISVIIPTYNRQNYITEAIKSVLDQNYDGILEVIISDDGSTDNTLKIAQSFGNKCIIIKKKEDCLSQGVSSTRNRGLKAATQPYICFLDSDDFFLPGHLNRIAYVLEQNSNIDFAFCRMLKVKEINNQKLFKPWTFQKITKNDILHPVVSRSNVVSTNVFLFRRGVFEKIGYFNESYSNAEDGDLWMRISEQYRGVFVDYYGAAYRVNYSFEQLTHSSNREKYICSKMVFEDAIERYYQLGLKSSYRIFSLRYQLLFYNYNSSNLLLYFKLLFLIFRHPWGFIRRILDHNYCLFNNEKHYEWKVLSNYISK